MPKRRDIRKIFIIGSGPIVIGQACEFDYSGTQACKALREEGYEVILVNSNPATIMTDPEVADRTYVEPLSVSTLAKILEREKPDALLPTVGGQTALNLTVQLAESGILREYGVKLIGARLDAIRAAEDRRAFRRAMAEIGLETPRSEIVGSVEAAVEHARDIGFPLVLRPSFTLGGAGGGIVYNIEELRDQARIALDLSPVREVLLEESVLGWKEYELEVMRDLADNVVIICSIENFDAMGVHTGDSVTVAPAQTLTDVEYQDLRDAAIAVVRKIGVETGGSNIQFAVDPKTGRTVVIEMNPRVSRSSALASKATGFPIAKIAAKLAVGYHLDEIPNDITRETPASFEPTIDYVVVKIPRFAFEKFPETKVQLGTQMKSVGETMSMGRTFKEALQKALRSLEIGRAGFGADGKDDVDPKRLREKLMTPNPDRLFYIRYALQSQMTVGQIHHLTSVDPWFLENLKEIVDAEGRLRAFSLADAPDSLLRGAKRLGFSDTQLAHLLGAEEADVRKARLDRGITPVFKTVDTCGAEFEARTPYHYKTYETETEVVVGEKPRVLILGGGPNRIGQGIEFDYCCVHAVLALQDEGFETIMVNNNPETVSTDYDTADKLYFEPLTCEDVLDIVETERAEGVIVQFGGQTPLRIARALEKAGVKVFGTSPDSIDLSEDRERFGNLLRELDIPSPDWATARDVAGARECAARIGYPVVVRPSYVLGGRAMAIVYDDDELDRYMAEAVREWRETPILIDRFLEDAFEADVDAICDGERVVIGGIMQHIEEAGVHSGDSACVLPSYLIPEEHIETMREYTRKLGLALGVRGLMNVQYALKDDVVYVIEVNPRASRTVPFVSKATGVPLAKIAARVMIGRTLEEIGFLEEPVPPGYFVKESVFPFSKFPGVDCILGPEMKSTGEVMGYDPNFGIAFAKAQQSTGVTLPANGSVFVSVNDNDKRNVVPIARDLSELGFRLYATTGTAETLRGEGIAVETVFKVNEGRPHIVDYMKNGEIDLLINTPLGKTSYEDERAMRRTAYECGILAITTLSGARAAVEGIRSLREGVLHVRSLQEIHAASETAARVG